MQFVRVGDISLCVLRERMETAQTLVFINSLGTDYRIWNAVITQLSDYDIIRYDKRGHGLSDCPPAPYSIGDHVQDLAGLLKVLNVAEAVLIGISVGGMIAMDFASKFPAQVNALIVADSFTKIGTADMWNERIKTLRENGMAYLTPTILSRWFTPAYALANQAAYRGYSSMLSGMPVEGYTGTCEAIRDADLSESIRNISCPSLILCGAEDVSTPPEVVRSLTEILVNARYVEISGAGHLPCVENPGMVTAAIRAFLKDVL